MTWFLTDPERFFEERAALDLLTKEGWLVHRWRLLPDSVLGVDLDMTIQGQRFEATMTYPAMFPLALPDIRPRDRTEHWSGHQYGIGGSLCLELRADNWRSDILGAELVRSAHTLLASEQHPNEPQAVPSAHRLTEGQALRGQNERWIATPDALDELSRLPLQSVTACTTHTIAHERIRIRFLSDITVGESTVPIDDLPSGVRDDFPLFLWAAPGRIFRHASWSGFEDLKNIDALNAALQSVGFEAECLAGLFESEGFSFLVVLAGDTLESTIAYAVNKSDPSALRAVTLVRSAGRSSRMPQEAQQLDSVRVGIVGAGSIGSKIAASLARAGVRRFVLVDDDVLLGENIARHELDWIAVGIHKVEGLRDRIRLIAPRAEIEIYAHQVSGQESPLRMASVLEKLSQCDLIVDATAEPNAFIMLASVAQSAKKPMVWAEVFAGGIGGLIARARPDVDPNPFAVRDGLTDHYTRLPPAPFQRAVGYDDTGDTPMVAYDSDVAFVAAAATHLALDTVLRRAPSDFPYPAYLLGMRQGWIFEGPFDTQPVRIEGAGWTTEEKVVTPEQIQAVFQAIALMCEPKTDAQDSADP
jgi:ubiquitin-protein ligase